ncbi:MAG: DUF1003 domain-containing protein [Chloroflexi bacterium]|nr:MAG: DUF1003 domain-containing protein [Chloroflexota bacterium]
MPSRHPVNQRMIDNATRGERVADGVSGFMGSWRFIILQTLIVIAWVVGNVYLLFHFDPYPFIFLNLAFSTQAAYAAPLILLAGNRSAARDRLTLEHAAAQADVEERQNERLLRGNTEILHRVEALEGRILQLETRIVSLLEGHPGSAPGDDKPAKPDKPDSTPRT